jgi:urease accessory protein
MHASAHLVATADAAGRTSLSRVRAQAPLLPRRTGTCRDGAALVHLVGGAAGPLGGDRLALEIDVGPGAALEIRSVAATVALPGPRPGAGSVQTVCVRVAGGATLRWLPEPLIAACGCDHTVLSTVAVEAGGRLLWRDVLACGRYGEEPGDVRVGLSVRYGGRPLLVHELAVGPAATGWAGAAVLGGAQAVGSMLYAGPGGASATGSASGASATGSAAVLPLAGPGVLTCAVGADADEVGRLLPPPVPPDIYVGRYSGLPGP